MNWAILVAGSRTDEKHAYHPSLVVMSLGKREAEQARNNAEREERVRKGFRTDLIGIEFRDFKYE